MGISGPVDIESVPSVPWKNGVGTTRTLVVVPDGAGLDDFLWRVSLARIEGPASFSAFPGVDRTILLWRGGEMLLRSSAWETRRLTESEPSFSFRGEETVVCELTGESAEDLNLMARRGRVAASMQSYDSESSLGGHLEEAVVLCARGRVIVEAGGAATLEAGCFLRIAPAEAGLRIVPAAPGTRFVVVAIERLD
jgi:uncharacterized protein